MDIKNWTAYFHDGELINIYHKGENIIFLMESSQFESEKNTEQSFKETPILEENKSIFSESNTIKGRLHVEGIKNITVNKQPFRDKLKKMYDMGDILDFEIYSKKVILLIEWRNYPPHPDKCDVSKIEIEAEKIWWENLPDLKDSE